MSVKWKESYSATGDTDVRNTDSGITPLPSDSTTKDTLNDRPAVPGEKSSPAVQHEDP